MKILLVLFSVVGLSLAGLEIADHLRAPLRILRKACIAETNVDEKFINMSRNGYVSDDPNLKCYILCLLEHSGMIEDDGRIHWTEVMHLLTPSNQETATHVSNTCQTIHGDSRCETAYLTIKCFFETAPEGSEIP